MPPVIYAHRGSRGHYPENTILAFKKAIEEKVKGIELDVHLTKDSELVIIHDETLERTTNGLGYVKDKTLQELKALDAGCKEKIPTLLEVLELLNGSDVELNIELKTDGFIYSGIEEKVLSVTRDFEDKIKIIYSSFHLPTLYRLRALAPSANIAMLLPYPIPHPEDFLETFKFDALHVYLKTYLEYKEHFKNLNNKIRLWSMDEKEEDKKQWLELEVLAIMTDYPKAVSELYSASS